MLKRLKKLLSGKPRVDYTGAGRNDDCPCLSGRKFKNCCIDKVEKQTRAERDAQLFRSSKG
ncbi:MAG TPA: SEC-C metal-binding domain-containing protein [Candidatus Polarisedimenticolia bacterium]|nr:SEC-C metal-binding domain-containing protein [Candidatus Polarisedimenticolia bacterium]